MRKLDKTDVVPEPSERWYGVICVEGRFAPGLSAAIAEAFHFVIVPWKIPARVAADRFRLFIPDRLYSIAIPPAVTGMVIAVPPQREFAFDCSVDFMGTSEPAKSIVPEPNCEMPAPEPTP